MYLKIMVPFFCFFLSISPLALGQTGSNDSAPEIQAQVHLKTAVEGILSIIQDPHFNASSKEQEQALYDKAMGLFDFETFSMLSLGKKYQGFSTEQKKDFTYYFSKLISQTYFDKLAGQELQNITIKYLENIPLKPNKNIFRTDILTEIVRGETKIPVVYRMIRNKTQEWKLYDVKIEGVSMVANYREQYIQNISQTPDEIIKELKEKVKK